MTSSLRRSVGPVVDAWNDFWFRPRPTSTLAVVRIAFGAMLLVWALALAPDLMVFYSSSGMLHTQVPGPWTWGLLKLFPSKIAVIVAYQLLLLSALAMILGAWTRVASVVAFLTLLSFERRNPFVINTGDWLLRITAFHLMFAPAGASLSVDRWRRHPQDFWTFPARSPWALRLIQIQISVIYTFTLWGKVRGTAWNNGTAVSYALRIGDFVRFHLPASMSNSLLLSNIFTFSTLAIEAAIAALVWNRRARPWVLGMGVLLHLSIEVTLLVGFFSYELFVSYLSFVPPDTMARLILRLRTRWEQRRDRGAVASDLVPIPAGEP